MTDQPDNRNDSPSEQSNDSEVLALLKRMQQQLIFLEKKIDALVNQSQARPAHSQEKNYQDKPSHERPSFREKSYPKPVWSSGRPQRPGPYRGNRGQDEASGDRGYGRSYEKRGRDERRGFDGPKREYGADRESRSDDRPFKKKFGGKKGGFSSGKKPFFNKRKDR